MLHISRKRVVINTRFTSTNHLLICKFKYILYDTD